MPDIKSNAWPTKHIMGRFDERVSAEEWKRGGRDGEGGRGGEGEAGERQIERLKERKKEKKEGKRETDRGRGVVTCALSYNRGSRPGICRHSRHQMTCNTTRKAVTEVDWTGTFMLSRGGETPLSDKVTLRQMKTDGELSGRPIWISLNHNWSSYEPNPGRLSLKPTWARDPKEQASTESPFMHHHLNLTHQESFEADMTDTADPTEILPLEPNSQLGHANHVHHERSWLWLMCADM